MIIFYEIAQNKLRGIQSYWLNLMVKYWLKLVTVFLTVGLKFSFIALIKLTYLIKWFQPLVRKNSVFMMRKF